MKRYKMDVSCMREGMVKDSGTHRESQFKTDESAINTFEKAMDSGSDCSLLRMNYDTVRVRVVRVEQKYEVIVREFTWKHIPAEEV